MTGLDTDRRAREYRDAYDSQLRSRLLVGDPAKVTVETVGPVRRKTPPEGRGLIVYTDLGGLDGAELDEFIAAQRDHFAKRGQPVEWKYHGYDRPADLPDRLRAAGFVPEETETIVIGEAADHVIANRLPGGVELVELSTKDDLDRVRVMLEAVWNDDFGWLPGELSSEKASAQDPVVVFGAQADGELVCAAWIRFHNGTEFTSLWGGSTLPAWRGKGIYRAMVARRAQLALARGFKYLQFDCTQDNRVILRRLGMSWVATTVPYVWKADTGN
ncbi:MAG: GNAT family N-acetyltransferase [Stackebrandtia sp.]